MFFSRALMVVFKTTGGKRWHGRGGLPPLTDSQRRHRKKNAEQVLKNMSVLKMAAAQEPPVPTRLYKPLNLWRQLWMRKKLEHAKTVLGWDSLSGAAPPGLPASLTQHIRGSAAPQSVSMAFESRVQALAERLKEQRQRQQHHLTG